MRHRILFSVLVLISCSDTEDDMNLFQMSLGAEGGTPTPPPEGPVIEPTDYVLIPIYGQSLSIAESNTRAPSSNMKMLDCGITGTATGSDLLVPLVQGNDNIVACFDVINKYSEATYENLIGCASGLGGAALYRIDKGTTPYNKQLSYIESVTRLVVAEGKECNVPAIMFSHGENDTQDSNWNYQSDLVVFLNDLNTDIKAITGQTNDVQLVLYQMASHGRYGQYPILQMQQKDFADTNPNAYLPSINYTDDYVTDTNVHGKAQMYSHVGANYGAYIWKAILYGNEVSPFILSSHSYSGLKSTLTFDVPYPPLAFDITTVQPHDDGNFGFKVLDLNLDLANSSNSVVTEASALITNVEIINANTIEITYDSDPTGSTLTYGVWGIGWNNVTGIVDNHPNFKIGRDLGPRGNLRDSKGDDIELNIYNDTGGLEYTRLDSWCPIFQIQL